MPLSAPAKFSKILERIVCHWTTEMVFSEIDPMICTHIVYNSLWVNADGELNYFDRRSDTVEGDLKNLITLRGPNPDLKILFSVGVSSQLLVPIWSSLAANDDSRKNFASKVLLFIQKNSLDGIGESMTIYLIMSKLISLFSLCRY